MCENDANFDTLKLYDARHSTGQRLEILKVHLTQINMSMRLKFKVSLILYWKMHKGMVISKIKKRYSKFISHTNCLI